METKLSVRRPADFIEFRKESILQGIHQRIEDQVLLYPEKIALMTTDVAYTYSEMNGLANSLAAEILSASGKELAQAAILQPNTQELIITMMASLKAHKAYVPLDCNFPKERLRVMLEDAEPVVLLTDDQHFALAEELAGKQVRIINTSRIERHLDAPNPEAPCDPLDRAYILYTSGSTGRPKGIAFLHRNLLHSTMCLTNELFFAPSDRVSWLHSPSFGSSVVDIYCCLTNGGTLYPWDPKAQGFTGMAEWVIQNNLTTFQWIPSAFRQFMRTVPNGLVFEDIRIVVMAGEPLTVREVDLFRRHFPRGSHLVNQVGTGESYNYHLYRVDHQIPIEDANVAGGYPVSQERQVLILDDAHREVPRGSVGEIAIQSDYMSAGYWRDEDLTRTKFIRLGTDETPAYLTGDLGKLEPDGRLIHLGRKDFQVKIRGCRVELAEVDHLLAAAPGVADATSWVAKNRLGEDQLVGYLVLEQPGRFNQRDVQEHLASRLPGYMVPTHYVILDSLPTLPTGKADRRALPNPFEQTVARPRTVASKTAPVAQEVLEVFKELLELDDVSLDTSFLEAGGDSLLSAVLMHRIHRLFNVEIAACDFLESPTPSRLANLIDRAVENESSSCHPSKAGHEKPNHLMPAARERARTAPSRAAAPAICTSSLRQSLVIIGAGQCGREAYTWAVQAIAAGSPWQIKGFLDSRADALDGYKYQAGILGTVDDYQIEADDVFIGAIGNPRTKLNCYSTIVERGGCFINLIHPLANIGQNVELGIDIVLAPFSSITSDVKIGNHVSIGALSNVAHDTVIGDWCQISSHCGINGTATLGEGVFLGSHACILPGVKVGSWAFVGAGSVVLRHVAPDLKVFGNPAIPIGKAGEWANAGAGMCSVVESTLPRTGHSTPVVNTAL
jgi:sugar O-acyltransferase (sialic acid O-acetyltransferase NeuD family)